MSGRSIFLSYAHQDHDAVQRLDDAVHGRDVAVWRDQDRHADDGREEIAAEGVRESRGGSWFSSQYLARSAFRFQLSPTARDTIVGFRVVCSSPISR